MINFKNYYIFDQKGNNLNLSINGFIPFYFTSDSSLLNPAIGYGETDVQGKLINAIITNSGWGYDPFSTKVSYNYIYAPLTEPSVFSSVDVSVNFKDVSIFNPEPQNSKGIKDVSLGTIGYTFVYPSVTYSGALFLDPISVNLVQTAQLYIVENSSSGLIRPIDPSGGQLVFKFNGIDSSIQLFNLDWTSQEIVWSDEVIYDLNTYEASTALVVNIGFRASEEGVFERKLQCYYRLDNNDYLMAEILVNAESIGEDERFRTLIANFGLPDPKNFPTLFKDADINETLPDWQIVNSRSKLLLLEYKNIIPYIGSYKGLINAIKWLGYTDINVREWMLNIKTGSKQSFYVSYDAPDRSQTLMAISADTRKNLKKLNQLSLTYCLNKDTGTIDEWGTPETEKCYSYTFDEVLVKLTALKEWLERYIIGVNCRIVDITGEGIYYQRFVNLIYNTTNKLFDIELSTKLSAITIGDNSELIKGDASILCTIAELYEVSNTTINLEDTILYAYEPSRGSFIPNASDLQDPSVLLVGNPISNNELNITEIQWKASVSKPVGVLDGSLVSNPLLVYHNELRFLDPHDVSSVFEQSHTKLTIFLEKAYLRNAYTDDWERSIEYSIYPDACAGLYWMESSTGSLTKFYGYVTLLPKDSSAFLMYAYDMVYQVPLLTMGYYNYTDASQNTYTFNDKYFLDIIDGRIVQQNNEQYTLNFNYDVSNSEQQITQDVVYTSERMPLMVIDPSIYYYDEKILNVDPSDAIVVDNRVYSMNVKDSGEYVVELYAWDENNNPYYSVVPYYYNVWIKNPTITAYIDTSCNTYCSSTMIGFSDISTLINSNLIPIYDRAVPLKGLNVLNYNTITPTLELPSISYFIDVPQYGSLSRFVNLTEDAFYLGTNTIDIDKDWQNFNNLDNVNLVLFDKNSYSLIKESSAQIIAISSSTYTLDIDPIDYSALPNSQSFYVQNSTIRDIYNIFNNYINNTVTLDVSAYQFYANQLVNIIATDPSGNTYAGAHRVISSNSTGTHTLYGSIPKILIDASCSFKIKHAYTSYAEYSMEIIGARELNNNFYINYNDPHKGEYFLDSTWTTYNIPFNIDYVNFQWYDPSTDSLLIDSSFWRYDKPIVVDVSTLVVLRSEYDPSSYLTNQRNIWTITKHGGPTVMKVWNDSVPFIWNNSGIYSITVESFDNRGNSAISIWDGFLNVK